MMAAGEVTPGRRLDDVVFGDLPPGEIAAGDYWKYLDRDGDGSGVALSVDEQGNLTGTVWGYCPPNGDGIGTLRLHTVREHDDGTATVAPGDGSSNSILHTGAAGTWHGYLDRGQWREV